MILIVDDEKYIRASLSGLLSDEGYVTLAVESAEKAEEVLQNQPVEAILLDIQMSGKDGLTFLEDNRANLGSLPVIVISGRGDIPTAVAAIKLGAYDYIEKPLAPERVLLTVKQALRLSRSLAAEKKLVDHILQRHEIVGRSKTVDHLRRLIEKAAAADSTILITGENGSGKELVANHIHYLSERKGEPLVTVNCPAVPEHLFESELFGHVKGAFTGADKERAGRFETAGRGTVFLDEIGDLPLPLQGKLLRVLESGQFEKVGSDTTASADCRVLAATNRDLGQMIGEGRFRQDLFYRLNVIAIQVPSLRDRVDDVPLLVRHFLEQLNADIDYAFTPEAMGRLASHDWPGNIRQLKNVVQQIAFECEPGEITAGDVERILTRRESDEPEFEAKGESRLSAAVKNFESGFLSHMYQRHQGNIAAMARDLKMDRGNLSRKLRQLGIV